MTWIYIFLAFVALILFFFFLPIRLTIEYDKNLKLYVKILFFKFSFDFSENKQKSVNNTNIKNKNDSIRNKNLNSVLDTIKKKGYINSLKLIINILKTSGNLSLEILKKINVNDLTFFLKLGGNDAASIAIKYGQACSVIYSLFGYIISIKSPEIYNVKVIPDFDSKSTFLYSKITVTITILYFLQKGIKYINRIKNLFQNLEVKK